nr:uncharacterized protein LOC111422678 [Onthophagus taurus]
MWTRSVGDTTRVDTYGKSKTDKSFKRERFCASTSLLTKDMPISKLWQLDVLGISDPQENRTKVELEKAVKTLFKETTVVNEEGRCEVQLPWKEGHPPLPHNYNLAKKRLQSVYNKLQATGDVVRYSDVFAQRLSEGIIEGYPKMKSTISHIIYRIDPYSNSSTTTKVRPVFDASAKEKGRPSLNDCLEKGINLIALISDVLLRFRIERVGVTSDIRKAFLQISLNVRDRDFLTFIWKTDEGKDLLYRHRRMVYEVNSSPFLLGATLEQHIEKYCGGEGENIYSESTVNRLKRSIVDNCVTSIPDEQTKDLFVREATALMAEGGFALTGWECSKIESLEDHIVPLLGLNWNTRHDTLMLCYTPQTTNTVITKRILLSYVQRIFDPIGVTSPTTLYPKLMLQKVWKNKIGWDEEIDDETNKMFMKWVSELPFILRMGGGARGVNHAPGATCKCSLATAGMLEDDMPRNVWTHFYK